jgi:group I intron endonuclease
MVIHKALLKYGYSAFILEILEYCEVINLIVREQYYIELLHPEYNILGTARSSFGFKHSEVTKLKLAKKSKEHLDKIKSHLKELNSKPFSPEVRDKISKGLANFNILTKGNKIVFTNLETQETLKFFSIREAALNMKISRNTIKNIF